MAQELLALRNRLGCHHEWITLHYGRAETVYGCKKCGICKVG